MSWRRCRLMSSAALIVSITYSPGICRLCGGSAECERKNLHARTEKLNFELSISDRLRLSDQLVQPLLGNPAVTLLVNVSSVRRIWRLPIDPHTKSHGSTWHCRAHDEMKVARVKTVRDAPIGLVQRCGFLPDCPIARQPQIIQAQPRGLLIHAWLVQDRAAGRGKVPRALIPDIIFGRLQAAPVGGRFETTGIERHQLITDAAAPGLGKQSLYDHLRLFVSHITRLI